jgi:hypothetical protein
MHLETPTLPNTNPINNTRATISQSIRMHNSIIPKTCIISSFHSTQLQEQS